MRLAMTVRWWGWGALWLGALLLGGSRATAAARTPKLLADEGVDTCRRVREVEAARRTHAEAWLRPAEHAGELVTDVPYVFLAERLIVQGLVAADDCPSGGLYPGGGANACGVDKAQDALIFWQNQFDDELTVAQSETGVPALLLKQVIAHESQFWPGDYPHQAGEVGLGHVTWGAAESALLFNPDLGRLLCEAGGGCGWSPPGTDRARQAGQVLQLLDGRCGDCPGGVDVLAAERSVRVLAQVLLGLCRQTAQVIYNVSGEHSSGMVDDATLWRLTLFNYNAGPGCLLTALQGALAEVAPTVHWSLVAEHAAPECMAGIEYAERLTP